MTQPRKQHHGRVGTYRAVQLGGVDTGRVGWPLRAVDQVQQRHQVALTRPPDRAGVQDGVCPPVGLKGEHVSAKDLATQDPPRTQKYAALQAALSRRTGMTTARETRHKERTAFLRPGMTPAAHGCCRTWTAPPAGTQCCASEPGTLAALAAPRHWHAEGRNTHAVRHPSVQRRGRPHIRTSATARSIQASWKIRAPQVHT